MFKSREPGILGMLPTYSVRCFLVLGSGWSIVAGVGMDFGAPLDSGENIGAWSPMSAA
jgi:hypothetical protein